MFFNIKRNFDQTITQSHSKNPSNQLSHPDLDYFLITNVIEDYIKITGIQIEHPIPKTAQKESKMKEKSWKLVLLPNKCVKNVGSYVEKGIYFQ